MQFMRRIAYLATMLISLFTLPAGAVGELRPLTDAQNLPVEIRLSLPPVEAAGLGLLAPGAAQLYLGDPLKASAYLGGSAALGAGAYVVLRQIFWPEDFITDESNALIMLNAAGLAWLVGGALGTLDAYNGLQSQQPPFERAGPIVRSAPARAAR